MLKIEAIIQTSRFEDTKAALEALEIRELIVSEVMDHDHGYATNFYRGAEYRAPFSRVKLEMLVANDSMDSVVSSVIRAARIREPGDIDGRILVYEVADAINIHSGEHLQFVTAWLARRTRRNYFGSQRIHNTWIDAVDKLGLHITRQKGAADVIVVDQAEPKPTDN